MEGEISLAGVFPLSGCRLQSHGRMVVVVVAAAAAAVVVVVVVAVVVAAVVVVAKYSYSKKVV